MAKHVMQVHDFAKGLVRVGALKEEELNNIARIIIDADANKGTLEFHIIRVGEDPQKILEALKGIEF